MNKINISFITDDALETLYKNSDEVANYLMKEKDNSNWLKLVYNGQIFEEKKYKINDIKLLTDDNYENVDFENSIRIYETLKDLPRYILTDERFWCWFNFTIGYQAALQAMKINSKTTFEDHWLFKQGKRRGIFFNVLARCYFRVALSIDEKNTDDKYYLTRFVIENPERFRTLSWRANSSQKNIVLGALRAEKDIVEKYRGIIDVDKIKYNDGKGTIYSEATKQISLYGSVRLIDAASQEDIYNFVYNKLDEMVKEKIESSKN
ncbi:MAG: hypothetical protein IJ890_02565 [Clostridia bacterium]|nr:hypothetical protein [Clostridia bacterium]